MTHYLVIGATSAIAQASLRPLANAEAHFVLVAKSMEKLTIVAADLHARGATVETHLFDASQPETIADLVQRLFAESVSYDEIFVAHGVLFSQVECEEDLKRVKTLWDVNTTSTILFLTAILPFLKKHSHGHVSVIGSVAGDRGRASLATYSASKAALDAFLHGYRLLLRPFSIGVLTIKPGYVETPMTAHLSPSPLTRSAEYVGRCIAKHIQRKTTGTIYVPRFWWGIMLVIRWLPEWVFRRLPV